MCYGLCPDLRLDSFREETRVLEDQIASQLSKLQLSATNLHTNTTSVFVCTKTLLKAQNNT